MTLDDVTTNPPRPWAAWSAERPPLPPAAVQLLREALGPLHPATPAAGPQALGTSRLPAAVRAQLVAAAGADAVRDDDASRAAHCGGHSYVDLVRRRAGEVAGAPDAVVLPPHAAAVQAVLKVCADAGVAVVPWGGGTSVVGGLDADRGGHGALVALDLARLDRLVAFDETSRLATFGAGVRTPALEATLRTRGFTLGHLPQSFEQASLGGYVVTRSAGQASTGYGRIDELVAGLRLATPTGELVLPPMPASAAGPDLRRLVLGSEGTLGVVTEATVRVRPVPSARRYAGWMLPGWTAATALMRHIAQDGPPLTVARVSDETETRVSLAMSGGKATMRRLLDAYLRRRGVANNGCLLIVGCEGDARTVRRAGRDLRPALREAGAVALGATAGRSWEHGRFRGPYLRDSLLDAGLLVETLETAAPWSGLPAAYDGVRAALAAALPGALVGCHISHLYPDGASLYFTVLAAAQPGREVAQWGAAKAAVNEALVAVGATLSHHHAVGTAHRDLLPREIGPVGADLLRAMRRQVDPTGILNPGTLVD